ncbi:MAG TPA: PEP-CTERM sorting domain-containing protein [Candidatus Acidoferrales bacterium]|nr:PEP-CTERM sorting domain-containing protein [Candidatus Acidoferrales bacterium]
MKKTHKFPFYLAAAAAAMFMITPAMADTHWIGSALDNDWNNPANWDNGVPGVNNYNVFNDIPSGNTSYPIIGASETANVGAWSGTWGVAPGGGSPVYPTLYGPEWGQRLDIYGSLNVGWYLAPVGNTSVINMYTGGSYVAEGIGLGENWWFNGGQGVTWNQYGGTANVGYLFWGGHLNLYGGTFTINENLGVNDAVGQVGGDSVNLVSDANRMIDLAGGELIINGNATTMAQSWETRGILEGNGVVGNVNIDTTSMAGYTILTAVPEPAAMALLGLSGLVFLLRRRLVS